MISEYDPTLFVVELAQSVESRVGSMVLGHTRLGAETSTWVPIPLATFTYGFDYPPNDFGTLIIGSETASVSLSFKGEPEEIPLYPSDRVRVRYDDQTLFVGTVDGTTITRVAVDKQHGYDHVTEFSASLVGTYAVMLTKEICHGDLPAEPAIDRIRRWVNVNGWD